VAPKPDAADQRCTGCVDAGVACTFKAKERAEANKQASGGTSRSGSLTRTRSSSDRQSAITHAPGSSISGSGTPTTAYARGSTHSSGRSALVPSGLAIAAYPDTGRYEYSCVSQGIFPYNLPMFISPVASNGSSAGSSGLSPYTPASTDPYGMYNPAVHSTQYSAMPNAYGAVAASYEVPQDLQHPLFDPQSTSYPHPSLMPGFLYMFFQHFGGSYTFLSYEESVQKYNTATLSPLLANVMAAMAAPYTAARELAGQDLQDVAKSYMGKAKVRRIFAPTT
jgi:hypothetical protein